MTKLAAMLVVVVAGVEALLPPSATPCKSINDTRCVLEWAGVDMEYGAQLDMAPDGKRAVMCDNADPGLTYASVYDTVTGAQLFNLSTAPNVVSQVAYVAGGARIAVVSLQIGSQSNGTVHFFDASLGTFLHALPAMAHDAYADSSFTRDGSIMLASRIHAPPALVNCLTGEVVQTLTCSTCTTASAVAIKPDGSEAVVYFRGESKAVAFKISGGAVLKEVAMPRALGLAYSADGAYVGATGYAKGSSAQLALLDGHNYSTLSHAVVGDGYPSLSFSGDGKWVASGSIPAKILSTPHLTEHTTFADWKFPEFSPCDFALSHSGDRVLVGVMQSGALLLKTGLA